MKSNIADDIIEEYKRKKRYQANKEWSELQLFIKNNCKECKNRKSTLCNITKDAKNKLNCVYKEV